MALDLAKTLAELPPPWPDDLLPAIRGQVEASRQTLVVLDDDPTGTQTVHDVPVLTTWSSGVLLAELQAATPCFYILTNSRSLPPDEAAALNRTIGQRLRVASEAAGRPVAVVSRSDSTLRGHFPTEVQALQDGLQLAADGWLLAPFFLEGGRYTLGHMHYVADEGALIPASETAYARDASFGYRHADLREWVAEKTGGQIAPDAVGVIGLDVLREEGPDGVTARLLSLPPGSVCAVDAAAYRDLEVLVAGLLAAEAQGRRYLYRTAASFVRVRAGLDARPLLTAEALAFPDGAGRGGVFVVGSYVPRTTAQLNALLARPDIVPVTLDVRRLLDEQTRDSEVARTADTVNRVLAAGGDVVLHTSRELVTGRNAADSLAVGQRVSTGVIDVVRALCVTPRFVVAKGGITSSDVATRGLNIRRARVLGQVLPGVPVWQTGPESRYPGLPYVVFPGNVGDESALLRLHDLFHGDAE